MRTIQSDHIRGCNEWGWKCYIQHTTRQQWSGGTRSALRMEGCWWAKARRCFLHRVHYVLKRLGVRSLSLFRNHLSAVSQVLKWQQLEIVCLLWRTSPQQKARVKLMFYEKTWPVAYCVDHVWSRVFTNLWCTFQWWTTIYDSVYGLKGGL